MMTFVGNIYNTQTHEPIQQRTTPSSAHRSYTNLRHLMTVATVTALSMLGRGGVMAQASENKNLRQPTQRAESQLRNLAPLDVAQKPLLTANDITATRTSLVTPVELVGFDAARGILTAAQLYTAYESAISVSEVIGRPLIEILSDPTFKQAAASIVGDASAAIFTDTLIQKATAAGSGIAKGLLTDADVQAAIGTVVGIATGQVLTDANILKVTTAGSNIAKGILTDPNVQAAVGSMVSLATGQVLTDANIEKVATAGADIVKNILADQSVQGSLQAIVRTIVDSAIGVRGARQCPPFGC